MEIGNIYKSECIDINHEGLGVFKVEGFTVFASGALVGEVATIVIDQVKSNYANAHIKEVLKKSPNRVKPICEVFSKCGGCDLMHMNYQTQLDFKKKMALETLKRIGNAKDFIFEGIIGMDNPYNYRNKVQIPYSKVKDKTICGFYKKKTHFIIPIDKCYIQPDECTEIAKFIKNLANEYHIDGYDELNKTGYLRHVLIRTNIYKEYMIILILKKDIISINKEFINKIINRYPKVISIIINTQEKDTNVILGKNSKVVYGKDEIIDEILGYKFILSHRSFFQINHLQTEALYSTIREYSNLNRSDVLLDAYCGVGSIGITLSKEAKEVYGIEIVPEAIENANSNAKLNNLDNIKFFVGASEKIINDLEDVKFDVAVFDPPRKGCDEEFLRTVMKKNIKKIVYVSCNIATLARDNNILNEKYELVKVKLVDMFPHSSDVETVALYKLR